MAKIDVYLRSIERFGAAGAILNSGQSVTLRFPTGDRHATQVTPHDQLVALVREVAPPAALDMVDQNRPAKFDFDSNGMRYAISVAPKQGAWQVSIEPGEAARAPTPPSTPPPMARPTRSSAPMPTAAPAESDFPIERGQYAQGALGSTSGSPFLDALTNAARQARATDVFLATGTPALMRVGYDLQPVGERGTLDAETISREVGVIAPPEARGAWADKGIAVFAYGDGAGRVRATLLRDHRGPGAALRLLVAEPPPLDRLGVAREVVAWLDQRGLVLVAGPSGSGRTTTLAALVRALGDKRRRVVVFEDPIEIVHLLPTISQRALGEHVPTLAAGVSCAMREGADAIAIGAVTTSDHAASVVEAVSAGHLVIAAIAAQTAREAAATLVDLLPYDRRDLARGALDHGLLGTIAPVLKGGGRSFDVVAGRGG
jgi:twitching motility protein PilT